MRYNGLIKERRASVTSRNHGDNRNVGSHELVHGESPIGVGHGDATGAILQIGDGFHMDAFRNKMERKAR